MVRTPMFAYDESNEYQAQPWDDPQGPSYGYGGIGGAQTGYDPGGMFSDGDQTIQPVPFGPAPVDTRQAMYDSLFGQPAAPPSGGVGDHLYTNDPTSAAYRGPATAAPSAGTVSPGQTGNLMQDFSSALRTLINGPSPKEAGMDVFKSAPVTAFNAQAKRNEGRDRQFLAERAAAGGYSGSGGFESGVIGLRNKTNENMDRFAGEQANLQEQGRRDELLRSLSMAMAFGDAEAARALQAELGRGSLAVQREGIASNRDTALDQLGYNYANMQNGLNQNWLQSLFAGL